VKQARAVQQLSRAQSVYETLRRDIKAGIYARGSRLREEDVAETLGVSRTPVREALSRLVSRGLLEQAANGLIVRELTRTQVLELYSTREVLEGGVAGFAAQHASPFEIANLERLVKLFASAGPDMERLTAANREFHNALYQACHNEYIMRLLDELNDSLALLPVSTFEIEGRYESAIKEHKQIVAAIKARNPAKAEEAARHHIQVSITARLQLMAF
jgi:DNA-binding GntR family transcriptional regulator